MGEKTLVAQEDLDDGTRLLQQLAQAGFAVTAAFWTYDPVLEIWRFIIAASPPAIESLVTAYGAIQGIIEADSLSITLDRISLIPDSNPTLANLHALAESDAQEVVEVSVGGMEIAGRFVDDIYLYSNDALRYEREVIAALQRRQPSGAVMRTFTHADFPRGLEADALLDDGERVVLVEIKARSRPLGPRDVFEVEGRLGQWKRSLDRPARAMIVSRGGFTASAMEVARNSGINLVQWTGRQDDEQIGSAIVEARQGPAPSA